MSIRYKVKLMPYGDLSEEEDIASLDLSSGQEGFSVALIDRDGSRLAEINNVKTLGGLVGILKIVFDAFSFCKDKE